MIELYWKTARDSPFSQINDFRPGSWVYAKDANLEDLTRIAEATHIDINDLRDSLDKYELPRMEHIDDNVLFFIRHPTNYELGLYTETLTMILTHSYVIAISPHRSEIIENLIASNTSLGTTQKSKLILHILLKITQDYTNNIKRVRASILGAEEPPKVVDSHSIVVLTKNEEILNQYLTSLVPMRNLLETMASGRYLNFYEADLDLLEDLMIAVHQSEDVCSVNIKSIRSLRDSYHIIFTNDVNRTIKLLTAVTIIFTIPTIVASIYGMNVALPFQGKAYAFVLLMAITLAFSIVAVILFRKNRWL
ncbi:MAG: magnesium transporter CorA family protein [Verrucomicrobia bacterium]|nr:magnesium transporter CorA family protein [Verrucomicrobiota bacterium]MDE3047357.1 magnesium transporter CorA family protein [Verrucomicrobiota bacterium]